jgi:hypothetical protein
MDDLPLHSKRWGVAMISYCTVDCDCGALLAEGYIDR